MDNAQCPSGGCHQCPRNCGVLRAAGDRLLWDAG